MGAWDLIYKSSSALKHALPAPHQAGLRWHSTEWLHSPLGPRSRDPYARLLLSSPVALEAGGATVTICLAAETYVLQEAHACLLLASCGPARNVGLQPAGVDGSLSFHWSDAPRAWVHTEHPIFGEHLEEWS